MILESHKFEGEGETRKKKMGGLQENGNGGAQKYRRMDSEENPEVSDGGNNNSSRKYVLACAIFASLNSVLLGYGLYLFPNPSLLFSNKVPFFIIPLVSSDFAFVSKYPVIPFLVIQK